MTNQDRARERLELFQKAARSSMYYHQRIETLREQVTSCTSALGQITGGWTGEMETVTVVARRQPGNPKAIDTVALPVKHIPRVDPGTRDPKAGEKFMVAILDQILEYERRIERNTQICREIEAEIDARCDGYHNLALKYRYIAGLQIKEVAERIHYSSAHTKRILADALAMFGKSIPHDPGGDSR